MWYAKTLFRPTALVAAVCAAALVALAACGGTDEEPPQASGTPTTSPGAAAAQVTPTPSPTLDTPTPSPTATLEFTDEANGYSVVYPAEWTPEELPFDAASRDFVGAVEFVDANALRRASISVFGNPNGLSLEDWIVEHNPIFFDRSPAETTIGGVRALLAPISAVGLPSPGAYVSKGSLVFGLAALTSDEFESLVAGFVFGAK